MSARHDVVVVGAGLGGLATAIFLQAQGKQVLVLEQAARAGGRVRSSRLDGGTVLEHGPLGWLDKEPAVLDLCDLLGLTPIPAAAVQKERRLWKAGRIHSLPKGPISFLATPVMPFGGRLRLFAEPFISRRNPALGEESVDAFARRRFGSAVADNLFAALVSGIYGGDAKKLSVQAAFPMMAAWEAEHGSCVAGALPHMRRLKREQKQGLRRPTSRSLCNLAGGMADMTDAMATRLGDDFRPSFAPASARRDGKDWVLSDAQGQEIARAPELLLATPTRASAAILKAEAPELTIAAEGQVVAPLSVVHFLLKQEDIGADLQSFGFLALRDQGMRPLGVQYASSIFRGQTEAELVQLRILMGGVQDMDLLTLTDEQILAEAWKPLLTPLDIRGEALHQEVTRLPMAIPQYDLGHLARRATFEQAAQRLGGLHFGGDALHGVGVTAVAARAKELALALGAS